MGKDTWRMTWLLQIQDRNSPLPSSQGNLTQDLTSATCRSQKARGGRRVLWGMQVQRAPAAARHSSVEKLVQFSGPLPSLVLGLLLNGAIPGTGSHGQVTHRAGAATLGGQWHPPIPGPTVSQERFWSRQIFSCLFQYNQSKIGHWAISTAYRLEEMEGSYISHRFPLHSLAGKPSDETRMNHSAS